MPLKARGKILREPTQNPGIVMIQGQQFRFQREGIWHSEVTPRPGLVVDVDLDNDLQVIAMWAVTDSQLNEVHSATMLVKKTTVASGRWGLFNRLMGVIGGRLSSRPARDKSDVEQ